MANLSDLTRKEQVLEKLKSRAGEWINGADLANESVGGSEGLKRLRELKREGWLIQMRKSPSQGSDQFQYRLAVHLQMDGTLAYKIPIESEKEVQNGGPDRDRSSDRSDAAPHPAQSTWMDPQLAGPQRDTQDYEWKPAKKAPGTLEHVFWITKHQRAIAAVGELGDGRWGWGLLVPANKVAGTPNRSAGHGAVATKQEAMAACEGLVREIRAQKGGGDID